MAGRLREHNRQSPKKPAVGPPRLPIRHEVMKGAPWAKCGLQDTSCRLAGRRNGSYMFLSQQVLAETLEAKGHRVHQTVATAIGSRELTEQTLTDQAIE